MPTPGLEPGRPYGQGILSPLRLPIPPSGLFYFKNGILALVRYLHNTFIALSMFLFSVPLKIIIVPIFGGV